MDEELHTIYVSKLDAAKRQLEIAIRLFMNYSDIIAIHSLTAASHSILRDLSLKQNKASHIKDIMLQSIKPEYHKKWIDKMNEAENFFKHADKDPDKLLKFTIEQTEMLMWDACSMYQNITNEHTPLILIYRMWFFTKNPDLLANNEAINKTKGYINTLNLDFNNRQQFLDCLPLAATII